MKEIAKKIFLRTLAAIDVQRIVSEAISNEQIDFNKYKKIIVIAIGKAAAPMARAIENALGDKITAGLIVTNTSSHGHRLPLIIGGHPIPNAASIEAATRALKILRENDSKDTLILFLISGGGSSLFEKPKDESVTLEDLREMNNTLVHCGAVINEINTIRNRVSAVKGGGLAAAATQSHQISFYISDVNFDDIKTIASGPTIPIIYRQDEVDQIMERYDLYEKLPESIVKLLVPQLDIESNISKHAKNISGASHSILMDNKQALAEVKRIAERDFNLITEIAYDLVEGDVSILAALHLTRLNELKNKYSDKSVCLISGGEVICPVFGNGEGGRNQEFVLRVAIKLAESLEKNIVVLSAGTDGIDGRSSAAGAVADNSTIKRAQQIGMDAVTYLNNSDSFSFFDRLSDTIITGPTNNNVRDIRIFIS